MTAAPYLVGPNGWFLRDAPSGKPLLWDTAEGAARPHDAGAFASLPGALAWRSLQSVLLSICSPAWAWSGFPMSMVWDSLIGRRVIVSP